MNSKAFTLIELLVVIAIVGILSGFVAVSMNGATDAARDAKRKATIDTLRQAIIMYGAEHGEDYPIEASECNVGSDCDELEDALVPTYLSSLPTDPVSGYYTYVSADGSDFTLESILSNTYSYSYTYSTGYSNAPAALTCPSGWIDSGHDFCVMKYEASNVGSVATSSGGAPWSGVTQLGAITACSNLGSGSHLITNAEWMLLARDIESVATNWTGGSVGSGVLKRGNVGDTATGDYNGADPETGTAAGALAILSLSNGQTINHLSGNVYEWTNDTCTAGTGAGNWQGAGWLEWDNANLSDYEKTTAGPLGSYTSTNGMGKYYGCTTNGNAFIRGGAWDNTSYAGIYYIILDRATTASGDHFGFRCAR